VSCPGVKTKWGKTSLERAHGREETSNKTKAPLRERPNRPQTAEKSGSYAPEAEFTEGDDELEEEVPPSPSPMRKLPSGPSLSRISHGVKEDLGPKTITEVYDILEPLGRGAFATVNKARHKETGELYAVKMIGKKNVKKEDLGRLTTEMEVLQTVKHPNIIELKEVFETNNMLYIVTEFATGGELFDRIVKRGSYTERDAAELVKKVILALEYLHSRGIAHRDLKPENLLLQNENEDTEVKIADFGLSKIIGDSVLMQTACGTPGYVAPEILQACGYGKEVDMWSVGVITYILLCGFPPFYNENIPLLFEAIIKAEFDYPAEYWDEISDTCLEFIDRLLVVDPKARMTASEALNHRWLKIAPATPLLKVSKSMCDYTLTYRLQSTLNCPSSADDSLSQDETESDRD